MSVDSTTMRSNYAEVSTPDIRLLASNGTSVGDRPDGIEPTERYYRR